MKHQTTVNIKPNLLYVRHKCDSIISGSRNPSNWGIMPPKEDNMTMKLISMIHWEKVKQIYSTLNARFSILDAIWNSSDQAGILTDIYENNIKRIKQRAHRVSKSTGRIKAIATQPVPAIPWVEPSTLTMTKFTLNPLKENPIHNQVSRWPNQKTLYW